MNLITSLENVKGVGPKTAEQFEVAGLRTVGDLIRFLPYRHEDYSQISQIGDIQPGKATIKARCESITTKSVRRGIRITTATLADDSGKLKAVWFNQPYRETQLKSGDEFLFSGTFEFQYNRYQLTNPSVEKAKDLPVQTDRILPVYHHVKGLKSQVVRKILAELRPLITMLPESLPPDIIKQQQLVSYADALLAIHFPQSPEDIDTARQRLGFDELFKLLLASQLNRQENAKLKAESITFNKKAVAAFVAKLPFTLTGDQRMAAWEIIQDFEKSTPMNRMLQGDVGSGKTAVAAVAALSAASDGYQTAFMAPTEILARQHAKTLADLLEPFGITVGLLVGGVKGKARQNLLEQTASGSVAVVVGTHALIQDSVKFHRLGFVVIDEQHRFGVAQRQALLAKAAAMPHMLSMTATPIPRSLQLTVFGELDISILSEKPANRLPIATQIVSPISVKTTYDFIDNEIAKGRQCYVVCSLIEDSESEKKSVESEYKKLKNSVFGHRRIGMLHGKMTADEKAMVMQDFKAGAYDILVSTTVIEVGVDVPNASVMMIENADTFGLAQLHQLRGRVGRAEHQSYCFLVNSDSSKPTRRLRELEKSNDGFYLAEVDLNLRGPGQIYGRAQHGDLNLKVASLGDSKLIARASKAAKQFAAQPNNLLQYKQLQAEVEQYQRLTTLN